MSDKSNGILDLLKADDFQQKYGTASPGAAAPAAAPKKTGQFGEEQEGHKYISREWVDGEWVYQYQDDPHPTAHGIENAFGRQGHTLDLPPSRSGKPHSNTPEGRRLAYEHATAHGPHNEPGGKYRGQYIDPITGQSFDVKISDGKIEKKRKDGGTRGFHRVISITPSKDPNGKKVKLIVSDTPGAEPTEFKTPQTKTGSEKFSTKEEADRKGAASAWAVMQAWLTGRAEAAQAVQKKQISSDSIAGPDGVVHGVIVRATKGHKMGKEGKLEAGAEGGREDWSIKFAEGSPLNLLVGQSRKLTYRRPERADAKARYFADVVRRLHNEQLAGPPPVAQGLATGKNHVELLQQGQVPFGLTETVKGTEKQKHTVRKFQNDWGSPAEAATAAKQLAITFKGDLEVFKETAELWGADDLLGSMITNIEDMDPESFVTQALMYTVNNYDPSRNSDLSKYLQHNVKTFVKYGTSGKGAVESGIEGGSLEDLVEAEQYTPGSTPESIDESSPTDRTPVSQRVTEFLSHHDNTLGSLRHEAEASGDAMMLRVTEQLQPLLDRAKRNVSDSSHILDSPRTADPMADAENMSSEYNQALEFAMSGQLGEEVASKFRSALGRIGKSIPSYVAWKKAVAAIQEEERLEKANFDYSHKEGNDMYPQYMYKDEQGNYSKRGNAPKGHTDYDGSFQDAEEDELSQETAPQFYTHDGRKLSRAPYTGADIQWNNNYHKNDPKNLWAARWVNPVTGAHEFSYIDSDLRENARYKIHRENSLMDNRLPHFRQYTSALFRSVHQKDKTVAVVLALLDQGRFRVRDLMALRVRDVVLRREVISLGGKRVHAGPNLTQQLSTLTAGRNPDEPLFATAPVSMDGEMDYEKMRRIGPHFIVNLLYELGVSAEALQTYHASQCYSMTIQRIFGSHNVGYGAAHHFSMLEVASEMGHRLDKVEDYETAIGLIEQSAVDPIVVQAIKQTCESMGIGNGGESMLERPLHDSVPHVSLLLTGRTPDEEEFSKWLRVVPIHDYSGQDEMEDQNAAPTAQMPM